MTLVFRFAMMLAALGYCLEMPPAGAAEEQMLERLVLEPPKVLGRHALSNHEGEALMFPLEGRHWQLVFFGYSSCPDICPMTLSKVAGVLEDLGKEADRVRTFFITIDAERDSAQQLKRFVTYFHPRIMGLTGTPRALVAVQNEFGVLSRKIKGRSALAYTLDHSVFIYLLDPEARVVRMYPAFSDATTISEDLKSLMADRVE